MGAVLGRPGLLDPAHPEAASGPAGEDLGQDAAARYREMPAGA